MSLFAIITVAFGLVLLIPGDPVLAILGDQVTPGAVERLRSELGLDRPALERYVTYLTGVLRGDLGESFFTQRPITADIARFLPATLELVVLSLGVAFLLGIFIGMMAAWFRDRLPDRLLRLVVTALQSIPDFVWGVVLIFTLFFLWRLVPPPGVRGALEFGWERVTGVLLIDAVIAGDWDLFVAALHQAVLPVLALGLTYSAYLAKVTRATMREALASDQVEFAKACGLPRRQVMRYGFTTARNSILTYLAILFGHLIGGAAIIETLFGWPGVGQWAVIGILKLDIPVIQGFILLAGVIALSSYLLLDWLVAVLDPRVSYE